jgi:hypothetical protein
MRLVRLLPAGLVAGLMTLAQSAFAAEETGGIKGTFVLKGDAPVALPLPPKVPAGANVKDSQVCAANPVPDETIVVDPATKGMANVFIWLPKFDEKDIPKDLQKPANKKVTIDNKGCNFVPHAFVIRTDQELVMTNSDAVAHNVHTYPLRGSAINDLVAPNDKQGVERDMKKPELLPIPVKCDIHPWMQAYMLVVDNPYAAVSDAKGEFEITGLPPGKYEFRIWQEAAGYVDRSFKVEVKAGQVTDLGKIPVDGAKLKVAAGNAAPQAVAGK